MAVSDDCLNFVLDQLSGWRDVSARRMFGGVGLYCGGTIFGVIADNVAYLKVDDSNRDEFLEAGSSRFDPYPDKVNVASYSYYEIPPEVLECDEKGVRNLFCEARFGPFQ